MGEEEARLAFGQADFTGLLEACKERSGGIGKLKSRNLKENR